MKVSARDDVICIQMPVSERMIAFYFKCVAGEWVRYKREMLGIVH